MVAKRKIAWEKFTPKDENNNLMPVEDSED